MRYARQFLANDDESSWIEYKQQCQALHRATQTCFKKKGERLKQSLHFLSLLHHGQNSVCQSVRVSFREITYVDQFAVSSSSEMRRVAYTSLLDALASVDREWTDRKEQLDTAREQSLRVGIQLDQLNLLLRKEMFCRQHRGALINDLPSGFLHAFSFLSPRDVALCHGVSRAWSSQLLSHCVLSKSIRHASQRWLMWQAFIRLDPITSGSANKISTFDELIEVEVQRTTFFSKEAMYSQQSSQRLGLDSTQSATLDNLHVKLRNLLMRFAQKYPAIGYGHGMTFLGATLLSALEYDEYTSFLVFSALLNHMQGLWHGSTTSFGPGLQHRLDQIQLCLDCYVPQLAECLRKHSISTAMFASSWVLSLFLNERSLPPSVCMHILDAFLKDGWIAMFQLYAGLLFVHADEIMADVDDDDTAAILKALLSLPKHLANGLDPYFLCAVHSLSPPLQKIIGDCHHEEIEREPHP
ncbi:hypothetical protein LEN26_014096 [Aphanomyces euteiches]|nr:hypothetical protein AeMF1_021497 [Aphanomyces euteiches]KAH9108976.1 hypothetical protein LEN26_014096 [Aphanomyces euteiches]KAH9196901.1 hypothetical protein AeNC1_001104 [Aphanomyces euteiches]